MCRFKSGILLKDRVYIGDGDSHSDMLEELGIADTQQNAERVFVRAELYPEDGDVFSLIDQWKWNVDQDILPDWYVEEYEKQRFAEAVKKWAEQHIFIGRDGLKLTTGRNYHLKDCKNIELSGDCFVALLESSQVCEMWGNSQVGMMWGSSRVDMIRESSQVCEMRGSSRVDVMRGNSQVGMMWDNSRVCEMRGSSSASISSGYSNDISVSSIRLQDNAIVKDYRTKTIYQAGDWKLVSVDQG